MSHLQEQRRPRMWRMRTAMLRRNTVADGLNVREATNSGRIESRLSVAVVNGRGGVVSPELRTEFYEDEDGQG